MVETFFYGLPFLTEPGLVFTPRATTEPLVTRAAALEPRLVADVGTGSGAIAVALALEVPDAEIWASDTSAEAVRVARANAALHGVGGRVHVRVGDLLDDAPDGLDLVLANLPYLPDALRLAEYGGEPPESVYAPGDGLAHYRRLLEAAEVKLRPGGRVLIQVRARLLEADRANLRGLRDHLESSAWLVS